MHLTH